ncbi:MAG: alpha/beta hydrolase [Verrucomicrobiae bacterium]|nr:alpha/beta hydrolase [Verrucomicrobiae bacterium]
MPFKYHSFYFEKNIIEGRAIDIFEPEKASSDIGIFFVHGGGWRGGTRSGLHKLMRSFNAEGFICATTDYRLSPKNTLFDQITDIRHGYGIFLDFLRAKQRPEKTFVIGVSAGAHLAALLTAALPGECGEQLDFGECKSGRWAVPIGAALQATPVTFEPWEDIFPHIWSSMQDIVGSPYEEAPELYQRVSPIRYVNRKTPSIFFLEAANEHMFPLEKTLEFINKMTSMGRRAEYKVYKNVEHGFFYDTCRRQQREAFADILAFIRSL